jgi:hypothetical protein
MNQRIYKTYTIDELSPEAREKALEANRQFEVEHIEWWDSTYDYWKTEKLAERGYEDVDISFRGFWSQGDGASFTAKSIDVVKWLKFHGYDKKQEGDSACFQWANDMYNYLAGDDPEIFAYASVKRTDHYYVHWNTVSVSLELESNSEDGLVQKFIDLYEKNLWELLVDDVKELSQEIYAELEKDHEYLTSDEAIVEAIKGNDIEFLENGSTDTVNGEIIDELGVPA